MRGINPNAVYIMFDGTSYFGMYGCDVYEEMRDDPDLEIESGPYSKWPEKKIQELNGIPDSPQY